MSSPAAAGSRCGLAAREPSEVPLPRAMRRLGIIGEDQGQRAQRVDGTWLTLADVYRDAARLQPVSGSALQPSSLNWGSNGFISSEHGCRSQPSLGFRV